MSVATAPRPRNEPILSYAPGTVERSRLLARLDEVRGENVDLPVVIGGVEVRTGKTQPVLVPHDRHHPLGRAHRGGAREVRLAVEAAADAACDWSRWRWQDRAAVFLRAAELAAGPWRDTLNAVTMLGQSKTAREAEIDAACELCDFFRINVNFAERLYATQPESAPGTWNQLDYRPLEGFVLAVSPFNFTSIAANLVASPALMGNTVVWKPSDHALLAADAVMRLLVAAGLPPGVVNLVPGPAADVVGAAVAEPGFAGLHFTGSSQVFRSIWRAVADRIDTYRSFPRLVGETGGKDFVVAHPSADVDALRTALVRGAFEYQGQKCSAASRAYLPLSVWTRVRDQLADEVATIGVGDVRDLSVFMGAVIDGGAHRRLADAIGWANRAPGHEVFVGGGTDDRDGWFVEPTVVVTDDPASPLLGDELFGPVLTVLVQPDDGYHAMLDLVDSTSPYALTGAVFADDRSAVIATTERLRNAAGNFYVNDKPTGAIVGQQPFGGGRASGTNDKAGSPWNLLRWTSPRTIKETFVPPVSYRYASMDGDGTGL